MDMTLDFVELELENIVLATSTTQNLIDEMICKVQEDQELPPLVIHIQHLIVLIYTQWLFVELNGHLKVEELLQISNLLKVVLHLLNMDILMVLEDIIRGADFGMS